MESTTYLKNLKVAPKKLRFYMPAIKKMSPAEAAEMLYYTPSKPARTFFQAIKSAIANAKHVLKVQDDALEFKVLTVEEGIKLKRFNAGARGTAKPYVKRFAHIKIVLTAKAPVLEASEPVKESKPKTTRKTEKKIEAEAEAKPAVEKKTARKKPTKVSTSKED